MINTTTLSANLVSAVISLFYDKKELLCNRFLFLTKRKIKYLFMQAKEVTNVGAQCRRTLLAVPKIITYAE